MGRSYIPLLLWGCKMCPASLPLLFRFIFFFFFSSLSSSFSTSHCNNSFPFPASTQVDVHPWRPTSIPSAHPPTPPTPILTSWDDRSLKFFTRLSLWKVRWRQSWSRTLTHPRTISRSERDRELFLFLVFFITKRPIVHRVSSFSCPLAAAVAVATAVATTLRCFTLGLLSVPTNYFSKVSNYSLMLPRQARAFFAFFVCFVLSDPLEMLRSFGLTRKQHARWNERKRNSSSCSRLSFFLLQLLLLLDHCFRDLDFLKFSLAYGSFKDFLVVKSVGNYRSNFFIIL